MGDCFECGCTMPYGVTICLDCDTRLKQAHESVNAIVSDIVNRQAAQAIEAIRDLVRQNKALETEVNRLAQLLEANGIDSGGP